MTIINTNIAETINIGQNGTYDVARYTTANVNTPAAPTSFLPLGVYSGVLKHSTTSTSIVNLDGATDLDEYVLYKAYYNNTSMSGSVDFSSLTTISGNQAFRFGFQYCTGITSVNLSGLKKISGQYSLNATFSNTNITSIDLSSLETLLCLHGLDSMLSGCRMITSLDLSLLAVANAQQCCYKMCENCSGLISVNLSSLKQIPAQLALQEMFINCTSLRVLSFPAINTGSFGWTNSIRDICKGITGITLHFPSNVQSVVEGLMGYSTTAPFGATSGSVLFDLPSTAHLIGADTVEYERNPKYDTATALAWRVKDGGTLQDPIINWTPYYTSGTTAPQVNDTIYSDSACTTAVTTISSIS